jgi:hypothetical protein
MMRLYTAAVYTLQDEVYGFGSTSRRCKQRTGRPAKLDWNGISHLPAADSIQRHHFGFALVAMPRGRNMAANKNKRRPRAALSIATVRFNQVTEKRSCN